MRYWNFEDNLSLWMDLDAGDTLEDADEQPLALLVVDSTLDTILKPAVPPVAKRAVDKFRYALAADYIEENWDRLLSIAETASGVDPEPLLRRLLHRLRKEWADYQNGVGK